MSVWKEFLERNNMRSLEYTTVFGGGYEYNGKHNIDIDKLKEFFLGEVVRIEKEIDAVLNNGTPSKGCLNYLEGQLSYVKKLAGVEEINE